VVEVRPSLEVDRRLRLHDVDGHDDATGVEREADRDGVDAPLGVQGGQHPVIGGEQPAVRLVGLEPHAGPPLAVRPPRPGHLRGWNGLGPDRSPARAA
jgi:hypothetical protein